MGGGGGVPDWRLTQIRLAGSDSPRAGDACGGSQGKGGQGTLLECFLRGSSLLGSCGKLALDSQTFDLYKGWSLGAKAYVFNFQRNVVPGKLARN